MDIAVVATFEDFDETLDKRLRGPGSGRKHASQAMLHYLFSAADTDVRHVDCLILDWKNPPKGGAKDLKVSLHRGASQQQAIWGSREQLALKFPANKWDIVLCTQARRLVLDFAGSLKAKRHLAMVHDYNLPFGPWGQEQSDEQLKEHMGALEKFHLLCASRHLTDFIEKWGQGRCAADCCYAAGYGYFDPVPDPMVPWEAAHKDVTFIGPCPEKGLSIFVRLAEALPQVQFLAIKTGWTKPWHEQFLKKFKNIRVEAATERIDDILKRSRVVVCPSVFQEAFGLVAVEAQLRGIPVISTATCGLAEANRVPVTAIGDISLVYDQRTHELIVGMTMDEAENTLQLDRPGCLTMEQWRQTAINQENYQKVASDADIAGFLACLTGLLEDNDKLRQASQDARLAAQSFVNAQSGCFLECLKRLHDSATESTAAPALISAAKFAPKPRIRSAADDEDDSIDIHQDFTKSDKFDGLELAAKCLTRLCEQGNLTVAAELIQAKADLNRAEPDVGITPLIGAANAGHVDICKYLFRKEADVDTVVADGTLRTALHAAANMGFASVVQLLLEKRADPRVEDLTKTTPLHLAVRGGHAGASELLLKHKANPNQSDDQGQVPINDAVAKDRFDLATKLLEFGALVNVRNMAGLEAISFSRTPSMQGLIMKHDINF